MKRLGLIALVWVAFLAAVAGLQAAPSPELIKALGPNQAGIVRCEGRECWTVKVATWCVRGDCTAPILPDGSCDDKASCKAKADKMCKDAGLGAAKAGTESVTSMSDGSKTCTADCERGGTAVVTCATVKAH